jgi:hypothetical protein
MAHRTCEHCPNPVLARNWCSKHYQAWRKYGDPLAGGSKTGRVRGTCSIKDCGGVRAGLGWCQAHYTNYRRHGDPEPAPSPGGRRIYALDDYFFDEINTEAKAYWLGFINADGCVRAGAISNGWQRHLLSVKLKASDAGHLEKLKADLAAESPVHPVPQRTSGKPAAEIVLSSPHLVDSLIRLGVTPRKSLTATPWTGPDDLMRHYWRGMVDGDGSIVRHAGLEKWRLSLCGSEACVEAFRAWAVAITGSAAKKYPKGNIWSWTAAGLASPQAIARELYGGATVCLDRKHERALHLMRVPIRHRSPSAA